MLTELQDLGLSEKEARVYLAALEIGRATADQLARQAKIVRPTTYVQLESLMKKGLMSTYEEGKKTYFAPESPDALRRVLEQQKQSLLLRENELGRILPDLLRQFESAGDRPVVRFFEGKEGINTMRREALTTKEKRFYVIYNHDKLAQLFSQKELDTYSAERAEKNIQLKSIYTSQHRISGPNSNTRFMATEKLPLSSDILIYDDHVGISSLAKKPFAILIEGEEISGSFKAIFELLWRIAEPEQ